MTPDKQQPPVAEPGVAEIVAHQDADALDGTAPARHHESTIIESLDRIADRLDRLDRTLTASLWTRPTLKQVTPVSDGPYVETGNGIARLVGWAFWTNGDTTAVLEHGNGFPEVVLPPVNAVTALPYRDYESAAAAADRLGLRAVK